MFDMKFLISFFVNETMSSLLTPFFCHCVYIVPLSCFEVPCLLPMIFAAFGNKSYSHVQVINLHICIYNTYLDSVHTHTRAICVVSNKRMWQNGEVQVGGDGMKPIEFLWWSEIKWATEMFPAFLEAAGSAGTSSQVTSTLLAVCY